MINEPPRSGFGFIYSILKSMLMFVKISGCSRKISRSTLNLHLPTKSYIWDKSYIISYKEIFHFQMPNFAFNSLCQFLCHLSVTDMFPTTLNGEQKRLNICPFFIRCKNTRRIIKNLACIKRSSIWMLIGKQMLYGGHQSFALVSTSSAYE